MREHPYETTWTTPHPRFDGPGPDLDKPCAVCGDPMNAHTRMSLTPAEEAVDLLDAIRASNINFPQEDSDG